MQRTYVLLISLLLTNGAAALDGQTRPVSPVLDWNAASLERFDDSWLHLKFIEGSSVELAAAPTASGTRFADADGRELLEVNWVLASAVTMRRTFPGDHEKFRSWKARGEATSGKPGPNLSLWFDVKVAGDRATLADTINALNALSAVEIAHPAPIVEPAVVIGAPALPLALAGPAMTGGTPDFTALQDYLYDTPVGLDAPSAWAVAGGRGAGMKFIDIELGWDHGHEDFDADRLFYQGGAQNSGSDHGTAVLGEVVGMDNGFGITGFAGDAQWGTVGILLNEWPVVPHRFMEAVDALDPGDVWLIELQMFGPGGVVPMEWLQVNYDVIWTGSWALDVVCIEAGANGSLDLDSETYGGAFDRNLRDSGAIVVAAGTPTGRIAESFTNHGSRMDVHAWGSQIVTTGYGDLYRDGSRETQYTSTFGGTSGASPMIAGSALVLQGIAREFQGDPLSPFALRQLLHDTGVEQLGSRLIGPRPDLGAAVEQLLGAGCVRDPEWRCDGDVDGDGQVNPVDAGLVQAAFGSADEQDRCNYDVDCDGQINPVDSGIVQSLFGTCVDPRALCP